MSKLTLIVFIWLCVFATVFFVSWPRYQELKNNQAKIVEKEVELQYKEQYFRDITDTAKELTQYKEELLKVDSILPSDTSIPALFSFLQTAASQNGLTLEGLSLSAVSEVSGAEGLGVKEISVGLSVSGSYSSLQSWLSTLEKTSRLIEVETISFSAPQEADKPFSFNLAIKTHSH